MIPVSVCLETVFTDMSVEDRIAKIAEVGYKYIEFWHPEGTFDGKDVQFTAKNAESMKKACADNGITINDFAMHAWDGSIGGCPVKAQDHEAYYVQIQKMIDFAKAVGCKNGIILSGTVDEKLTDEQMKANLLVAFKKVTEMAEAQDFTLLIEPLNTLVDHAGYFLDCPQAAADIIREINSPNLKLLFDVYHMQIMQGNIIDFIEKNIDIIGHFHSAGVPGRAELFDTEINYPAIIKKIDELGFNGCFGLEYFPELDGYESLTKTLKYLNV